jgi:hypothetical protein
MFVGGLGRPLGPQERGREMATRDVLGDWAPMSDGDFDEADRLSLLEASESAGSLWERMLERLDGRVQPPTGDDEPLAAPPSPT